MTSNTIAERCAERIIRSTSENVGPGTYDYQVSNI